MKRSGMMKLTGFAIAALCLKAGMNDFLAKPVNPDNLYSMIERWSKKSDLSE